MGNRRQLESILLIFVLVATSLGIIIPLIAPEATAIQHLASTADEDGVWPYDTDGMVNNIVVWTAEEDHQISGDYLVNSGYTLNIPGLDFNNDLGARKITLTTGAKLDVWGTLITNSDGNATTKTLFWSGIGGSWEGILFRPGASGNITDCWFMGAARAVSFSAGITLPPTPSTLLYPGITDTYFIDFSVYALNLDNTVGYMNMENCYFDDVGNTVDILKASQTELNIKNSTFHSRANNTLSLHVRHSNVNVEGGVFWHWGSLGNVIHIEDKWRVPENSNESVFSDCTFKYGAPGDYYVRVDGATPKFVNCSFDTTNGELSIAANENSKGVPSHLTVLNPSGDGSSDFWDYSFDNTTMNAGGNSSILLQWYVDVFVVDTDDHPVRNALVLVNNTASDPAEPPSKKTDLEGWARLFAMDELTLYNSSVTYHNPFNVTAINNSMFGYIYPEPATNMSIEVMVIVPLNPIPNILPHVAWLTTPVGVQNGDVTIQYRLIDPNPGENGALGVTVFFSTDGLNWEPAAQSGDDPTTGLFNDTVYTYIWNSKTDDGFGVVYNTTVYLRIVPYDGVGDGEYMDTGKFTVDNKPPKLMLPPTVSLTDTTALIEWTIDEAANATVDYGLFVTGNITDITGRQSGSILTTAQSVTLTGLLPGRKYTFIVTSNDTVGNIGTSYPTMDPFTFVTQVRIDLYVGWNMISVPPFVSDPDLGTVLSTIAGEWVMVQWYDPADLVDPWKNNVSGKPFGNDLHYIFPERGLWILMKSDATLIPEQNPYPEPGIPPYTILLLHGWNFVGYPSADTRTVAAAMGAINYSIIQTFDAATSQWLFNDGPGGAADTLTEMEMGRGYWVHSPDQIPQEWNVAYT